MGISSLGAGSGLDLGSILSSLMQVEQQPLVKLQLKEASYQSRISAMGSLKSSLATLQSSATAFLPSSSQTASEKYASYKATVADTSIATATAGTGAVAGSYSLEVSSLAQNQRLVSAATPTFTAGNIKIELGTLNSAGTVYTADSARDLDITIEAGKSSIEEVRDAINMAATDGRVSATIINGSSGKQLVLTSSSMGLSNVMQLSGTAGLSFTPTATTTGTLSQSATDGGQAASNAAFKLNGISGTSSTNSVSGMLDGVTLSLLKTTSSATTLTVTKDSVTALTSSVNSFIKSFNDANTAMKDLGKYDAATKSAGALQGDNILRGAQTQIKNFLLTKAGGSSAYQTLSDIGISLEKDGALKLDSSKLSKAVQADYAGVTALVEKIGSVFKDGIESIVGTKGTIATATESTNRIIKDLSSRQSEFNSRLARIEARYTKQFSSLDTLVASMKQTSSYLTQQLAGLTANTNS